MSTVTAGLGWPELSSLPRDEEAQAFQPPLRGGVGWPETLTRSVCAGPAGSDGGATVSRETVEQDKPLPESGSGRATEVDGGRNGGGPGGVTAQDSTQEAQAGMEAGAAVDLVRSGSDTGAGTVNAPLGGASTPRHAAGYEEAPYWPEAQASSSISESVVAPGEAATGIFEPAAGADRVDVQGGSPYLPADLPPESDDDTPPSPIDLGTPSVARTEEDTPIAAQARLAVQMINRSGPKLPKPTQTRVLVVANQKGGVGKTTTAVNLAAALAIHGARVLVIDLDPQGNASTALGIDHHADVPSVYDVLVESMPLQDVIQPVKDVDGLYCAPATIDLAGAEIELVSLVARESRLQRALAAYDSNVDYIFVDCPPSLGLLTVNALVAGEEVLIPIQCEYYALEGLGQLLRNVDLVRGHLNPKLRVSTILLTMYDGRTRLAAQVADEVRLHFPDSVLRTTVPRSVRISEAPSYGQTVMTYDPGSSGALSYLEAAREMAIRGADDAKETR